jgi:thiamine biosynthesis lipoprotein
VIGAPLRRSLAGLTSLSLLLGCHESAQKPPAQNAAEAATLAATPKTEPSAAPNVPRPFERVTAEGKAMGTHLAFAAFTNDKLEAAAIRKAFDAAISEIQRVEGLMTTWRESAQLAQANANAGKKPVPVDAETFLVLKEALKTSELSQGTFDITFETLHGLWKFDQDIDPSPPSAAAIKARLPNVGYRFVKLDEAQHTVFITKPETRISLGGIAKGYGIDRAVSVLKAAGLDAFYAQAGGDLYAAGKKPDGSEWSAGVRDPRGPDGSFFAVLPLSDHAFSTAGDYERAYVVGGRRYHHIIDPRTGYPATACRSVTIWAKTALQADAIDDAVFILGPEKGMALVESLDDVGAVVVDAKNSVWISKRLQGKLKLTQPPTEGL